MTTHTYRAGLRYDAIDAHNFHKTQEHSMPNPTDTEIARLRGVATSIYNEDSREFINHSTARLEHEDRAAMVDYIERHDGGFEYRDDAHPCLVAGIFLGALRRSRKSGRSDSARHDGGTEAPDCYLTGKEIDQISTLIAMASVANLSTARDLLGAAIKRGAKAPSAPSAPSKSTHALEYLATVGGPRGDGAQNESGARNLMRRLGGDTAPAPVMRGGRARADQRERMDRAAADRTAAIANHDNRERNARELLQSTSRKANRAGGDE